MASSTSRRARVSGKKAIIIVLLLLTPILAHIIMAYSQVDEWIEATLARWIRGEPVVVITLDISTPRVDADKCFVAVHRFPTMYNPTSSGTERLYAGIAKPGESIRVRFDIVGIPVKYSIDPASGRYEVEYYEPQELFVLTHCVRGGETVFRVGRVIEVYPKSVIHTEAIELGRLASEAYHAASTCPGTGCGSSDSPVCLLDVTGGVGYCNAWVRGPYLYSIDGLEASYGIASSPVSSSSSAIYLEQFYDSAWCTSGHCQHATPQWGYGGKKLAPSLVSAQVDPLPGDSKVRVYFMVEYRYEEHWYRDSASGDVVRYRILYPHKLKGVERADYIVDFNAGGMEPYTPPPPPGYATRAQGDLYINFGGHTAGGSNIVVASTSVRFISPMGWTAVLDVNLYGASRDDSQYTTPYVSISDVSGRPYTWYYWWFKDNDPSTLEVLVGS
ncbi:MAG: hypothetical protein GSR84_05180 [Desulfurococcales archaeon]|nr:hypothetical protein [Desulfurococcales archaeon]